MKKIFEYILLLFFAWIILFTAVRISFEYARCWYPESNYDREIKCSYLNAADLILSTPARPLGVEVRWGNSCQEFSGLKIWGKIIYQRLIMQYIDNC